MRHLATPRWLLMAGAAVAVVVAGTATSWAQVQLSSLDEVRREVAAGDAVSIVRKSGGPIAGWVIRIADTTLEVRPKRPDHRQGLAVTVPLDDLTSLERLRDTSRDGALIGAGVGGGAALALIAYAAAVDYNEIDEWGPIYAAAGTVVTGIGALAGWAIDRSRFKPLVRFDARPSGSVTTRLAPLPGRRRSLAIVVGF
jgi:HAMP domain-containing protein